VIAATGDIRSFLDGKQIRPVLFFSDKPFEAYPDIPCSKKLGYDVKLTQFRVIIAKAGTSPAQVKVLTEAIYQERRQRASKTATESVDLLERAGLK